MSGSEIIVEIEKRTNGRWKPSPGSIYPLLAWLQDNGYVKEMPTDQNGLKRYELTDSGRSLLEDQRKMKLELGKEARFFAPPFLGALWFRIPPEKTAGMREAIRRLMASFFELGTNMEERFSEQAMEEAQKALSEVAKKLEEINLRMKDEKHE